MEIIEVGIPDRRRYLSFLLMADESEEMVGRYIGRGDMLLLMDHIPRGLCIVTDEGEGTLEIKNLVIYPESRRMGYGRALIEEVVRRYRDRYDVLQVGTGDSPLTIPFYERCGFVRSHIIKGFFIKNYDHEIVEGGVVLEDMVYLRRPI